MKTLMLRWALLLVLITVTVGLALLPIGAAAVPAALIIAFAMAAVIVLACMHLASAPRLAAIFAIAGLCWFAVLLGLGSVDYRTRTTLPVAGHIVPSEPKLGTLP
jgi:cytochrome c oxidase subunit IV